jgi:hypothetical protein
MRAAIHRALFVASLLGCASCATQPSPRVCSTLSASEQLLDQSTRLAARAAMINLSTWCRATDAVDVCVEKLIAIGQQQTNLSGERVKP